MALSYCGVGFQQCWLLRQSVVGLNKKTSGATSGVIIKKVL